MPNVKCVNLTDNVISAQIDNIRYEVYPKGTNDVEHHKYDHCFVRPEHAEHPALQAFILCNPPKIKLIYANETNNVDDMKKMMEETMSQELAKIAEFKAKINTLIDGSHKEFGQKLEVIFQDIMKQSSDYKAKIKDMLKDIEEIQKELDNLKNSTPKPAPVKSNIRKGAKKPGGKESVSSLFDS